MGHFRSFSDSGSSAEYSPFQILTKIEKGKQYWGINYYSRVWNSLAPQQKGDAKISINGLLSDKPFQDGATGWRKLIDWDIIWLTIIFGTSGGISCYINSLGQNDKIDLSVPAWSGKKGYIEDNGDKDNPVHQTSRKLIGYSTKNDSGGTEIVQSVKCDQLLKLVIVEARSATYPFDHSGGYPYEKN
jgi:hypothetical protein